MRVAILAMLLSGVGASAWAQTVAFDDLPAAARDAAIGYWRQARATPYACYGLSERQFRASASSVMRTDYNQDGRPDFLFQSPCQPEHPTVLVVSGPLGYRVASQFGATLDVVNGRTALLVRRPCEPGSTEDDRCLIVRFLEPQTDRWTEPQLGTPSSDGLTYTLSPPTQTAEGAPAPTAKADSLAAPSLAQAALQEIRVTAPPPAPVTTAALSPALSGHRLPASTPNAISSKRVAPNAPAPARSASSVPAQPPESQGTAARPSASRDVATAIRSEGLGAHEAPKPTVPDALAAPAPTTAISATPKADEHLAAPKATAAAGEPGPRIANVLGAVRSQAAAVTAQFAAASAQALVGRVGGGGPTQTPSSPLAEARVSSAAARASGLYSASGGQMSRTQALQAAEEEQRAQKAAEEEARWKVTPIEMAGLPPSWTIDREKDYRGTAFSLLTEEADEYARVAPGKVPNLSIANPIDFAEFNRTLDREFRDRRFSRTDGDSIALLIQFFADQGHLAELKRYVDFYAYTLALSRMSGEERLKAEPRYFRYSDSVSNHYDDSRKLIRLTSILASQLEPKFSPWLKAYLDAHPGKYPSYSLDRYDVLGWKLGESAEGVMRESQRQDIEGMRQEAELRASGALTGTGWKQLGRTVSVEKVGANWVGSAEGAGLRWACQAAGYRVYAVESRQHFEDANREAVIQRLKEKYGEPSNMVSPQNKPGFWTVMIWGARYPNSYLRRHGANDGRDGLIATLLGNTVTVTLTDKPFRQQADRCTADAKAAENQADLQKLKF